MREGTHEATIELSAELLIHELSEAACALYGVDEASVRGRALGDVLLTDTGRIDWQALWKAVLAGKSFERLMLHRSCSGLRIWVVARLAPKRERSPAPRPTPRVTPC